MLKRGVLLGSFRFRSGVGTTGGSCWTGHDAHQEVVVDIVISVLVPRELGYVRPLERVQVEESFLAYLFPRDPAASQGILCLLIHDVTTASGQEVVVSWDELKGVVTKDCASFNRSQQKQELELVHISCRSESSKLKL